MELEHLLSLGDHPALHFLNSCAAPGGRKMEWITDGEGYLRWLVLIGLISEPDQQQVSARFAAAELDAVATEARGLRNLLRPAVESWASESSDTPDNATVAALGDLLPMGERRSVMVRKDEKLILEEQRVYRHPRALLAPVAEAAASLFVDGDPSLVRNCDSAPCTIWFYDRTRSHRRRWCAMSICGNREKVREHRARLAQSN
ncbi:hypothetical protein SRB17_86750 [Streptomyces sp. RB17]|uniref:CGNR zinc finger domain-containing protein n=1 Tax=Streptomyces sp. RB17 TaxID=2585197 RepID=UPI0012953B0E|nr:CGNR zinc finger domain-containing protein [Streptomyces sp. RB17]MQY40642.1 hypothetical protein [Streptomyces sp. RB17]